MQSVGNPGTGQIEGRVWTDHRAVAQRQLTASIITFVLVAACGLFVTLGLHRGSDRQDRVAWSARPPIIKTIARSVPSAKPQAADQTKADRGS